MQGIVFYFSGTGNSYAVTKELIENLHGFRCAKLLDAPGYDISSYDVIGFVFPVYYIHAPSVVLQAIKQLNFIQAQRVFCVATYGASYGYALSDVRNILMKFDVKIQEFRVKMPGNYLLEYGAFPLRIQQGTIRKAKKAVLWIVKAVRTEEGTQEVKPNTIARLFKNSGNGKDDVFHQLGKQFYATNGCHACHLCASICPVANIISQDGAMVWLDRCQQCMACVQWCPQNAVAHPQIKKSRNRYTYPEVTRQQLWGNLEN